MTKLLLPRWGSGNAAAWTPNITAVTRGSITYGESYGLYSNNTAPVTGSGAMGASHFATDGYTGFLFTNPAGVKFSDTRVPSILFSTISATGVRNMMAGAMDGNPCSVYAGEAVTGMFMVEVDRLTTSQKGRLMKFIFGMSVQYAGVDNTIRKQFTINGNTYELVTWVRSSTAQAGGGLDAWPASWQAQLTFTWVPYEAASSAVGSAAPVKQANPGSGTTTAQTYGLPYNIFSGGTFYLSVTKSTVDAVQQWIIGDLIESEDFASSVQPHAVYPGMFSAALPQPGVPNMPLVVPATVDNGIGLLYAYGTPFTTVTPTGTSDMTAAKPVMGTSRPNIGGAGTISGVVKVNNVIYPQQKVVLFRMPDHLLMGYQWSGDDGSYSFPDLNPSYEYMVVSHDYSRTYNAVVQDMITPVVPT